MIGIGSCAAYAWRDGVIPLLSQSAFETCRKHWELMNIDEFRRIYPEYDAVPDEVLCEKLRALFFPNMQYADFAKHFLIEAKDFPSTVLPELYVKRGDAYAALKQSAKANIEYDRVSRAFPEFAAFSFVETNGKRIRKQE